MARQKLKFDDYIGYMKDVATSRCVLIIKKYFDGDIAKFYAAPGNYAKFKKLKSVMEKNMKLRQTYSDIEKFNLAGIEKKYVRSIVGNNYFKTGFMNAIREKLTEHGWTIFNDGSLTYKGKSHPYPTRYIPPKHAIERIFSDPKLAKSYAQPSFFCSKVRRILEKMATDNAVKAGKDVTKITKKTKTATTTTTAATTATTATTTAKTQFSQQQIFHSWKDVETAFLTYLMENDVGSPSSFESAMKPLFTPYIWDNEIKAYWARHNEKAEKYRPVGWFLERPATEKMRITAKIHNFVFNIYRQLMMDDGSKLLKDEYLHGAFIPADANRLAKVRKAMKTWLDKNKQYYGWYKREAEEAKREAEEAKREAEEAKREAAG